MTVSNDKPGDGEWYFRTASHGQQGPVSFGYLQNLVATGRIAPSDAVWNTGLAEWTTAANVAGLHKPAETSSAPAAAPPSPTLPALDPLPPSYSSWTNEPPPQLPKSTNYFVQHWRGNLALPISYWVNGFLFSIGLVILANVLGQLVGPIATENPIMAFAAVIAVWLIILAISIWQLVGIWRSATRYTTRGGKVAWAGLAKLAVVIGSLRIVGSFFTADLPQLVEYAKIIAGDGEIGDHQVRVLAGGKEIELVGGIAFGTTNDVQSVLDANRQVGIIHLTSPGGRVGEARKLALLIRSRGLTTYVSGLCASACTEAFMGGVQRLITAQARLGFHQGAFPGMSKDDLHQENEAGRWHLIAMGALKSFADKAYATPNDSMWYPTQKELLDGRIATQLVDEAKFAPSVAANAPLGKTTADRVTLELLKIPLYVTIQKAAPETFAAIRDEMVRGVNSGKSFAELVGATRDKVTAVTARFAQHASDAAVTEMTEVFILEVDVLNSTRPDICFGFVAPESASAPTDLTRYFSKDLVERDLAASESIISSGYLDPQPLPTKDEAAPILNSVIDKLRQIYGAKLAIFTKQPTDPADYKTYCEIMSALFSESLKLPADRRGKLIRYLMAQ